MKIRSGFVSNSSSCSFIVFVPSYTKINKNDIEEFVLDRFDTDKLEYGFQTEFQKTIFNIIERKDFTVKPVFMTMEYGGIDDFIRFLEKAELDYIQEDY